MNMQKLARVVDMIEANPRLFNQRVFGSGDLFAEDGDVNYCGTPACIAGWAACLGARDNGTVVYMRPIRVEAAMFLEATEEEVWHLFAPYWPPVWFKRAGVKPPDWSTPNAKKAAKVLRAMIADGHVWNMEES